MTDQALIQKTSISNIEVIIKCKSNQFKHFVLVHYSRKYLPIVTIEYGISKLN